ncbi:alpha/beta fold hydrolase [Streptomyces humi]|uniref:alpha/beta fold hydrolase n=1 Tax=Streptomyces humi TaxID=1428620 RepID=UPI000628851C|nr:alpha/beta hydrolase [Streptomyces humi]
MKKQRTNPTVLLVHGAMYTPWIFDRPRERLTVRGIGSHAVQLPSSNPDSGAAEGLTEDVTVVRDPIADIGGPAVLAAHSYVVATEDPALPPAIQWQWAARPGRTVGIPSGHSPHLSHADDVARVLAGAVARTRTRS